MFRHHYVVLPAGTVTDQNLTVLRPAYHHSHMGGVRVKSWAVSSKVAKAHRILNYPGLPAVSGEELAQAYKRHLDELQIAVTKKRVHAVYAMGSYFAIQAGQEQYRADSVILACGMTADKPFPGENEFLGRGVSYCATCDAQFFKGIIPLQ